MDLEHRRRYYKDCDPYKPLELHSDLYVDLDNVDGKAVRGVRWSDRLRTHVELSGDTPVQLFFTGLPGSGKSTELRRVASQLQEGDAKLLSVVVDAEDTIDIHAPTDVPDVLIALLWGAEKRVLEAENGNPEKALAEGVFSRIFNWIRELDPEIVKLQANLGIAEVALEMKTGQSLRRRVRETVALHLTTFLKHVRDAFDQMQVRVQALGYAGMFLVLDSLEKLRGSGDSYHSVVESAERVFSGGAPYLQLPVHVLYTVPPALLFRPMSQVDFLPMIKLADRSGRPFEEGYHAVRKVIRRRVPDEALREMLGAQFEARVHEIIGWSGGYLREVMFLLREVIVLSTDGEITESSFQRMFRQSGEGYRRAVYHSGAIDWLGRVAAEKTLRTENEAERRAASDMLQGSIVFRYLNDEDWYDLHPAVRDMPEIEAAVAATKRRGAKT